MIHVPGMEGWLGLWSCFSAATTGKAWLAICQGNRVPRHKPYGKIGIIAGSVASGIQNLGTREAFGRRSGCVKAVFKEAKGAWEVE